MKVTIRRLGKRRASLLETMARPIPPPSEKCDRNFFFLPQVPGSTEYSLRYPSRHTVTKKTKRPFPLHLRGHYDRNRKKFPPEFSTIRQKRRFAAQISTV